MVWQEIGKIYYSQFNPTGGIVSAYHFIKECVSEATAWTTHMYPCITLTYNYYPNVMWQAHHSALELDLVNHRRRNLEGWENTTTFLGEDENYLKPTITGFPGIQDNYKLKSVWRSEAMGLYVVKFTGSSWIPYFISNPYSFDPNLSVNKSTTENCRMVYRNYNSLPYLLDVTSQYLEDDPEEESLSKTTDTLTMIHHRKGVIKSAESEIAFELGRVKIDGRDVEFLPLGDSLVVGQHINLKQVFRTNPFIISDQSQLEFSFGSMIINRSNLIATTPPGKDIEFSVSVVDAQSGQIIFNLDKWSAIQNLPSNKLLSSTFTFNIKGIKDVFLNVDLNLSKGISAVESLVEVYYINKDTLFSKPSLPGNEIMVTSQIPTKYELYQNFPNPYNPETTISFDLPRECTATLQIFNSLGEHVTTLVSQRLQAGTHQYTWNSGTLASGVYIYRLETEGFLQTRKMILMK